MVLEVFKHLYPLNKGMRPNVQVNAQNVHGGGGPKCTFWVLGLKTLLFPYLL